MSRWFTRHEELMTSADKLVFALTTQWGANGPNPTIRPMIEFARKQGYTVEELERFAIRGAKISDKGGLQSKDG